MTHDFCRECPLREHATNLVPGVGGEKASIMLVGEAPGREEDEKGRVFVGRAGRDVLRPILKSLGLKTKDVAIYNTLMCRPPDNNIKHKDAAAALSICPDHSLFPAIKKINPLVIVALGNTSYRILTGERKPMKDLRGSTATYSMDGVSIPVIPTYHPASALPGRSPRNRSMIEADLRRAVAMTSMGSKTTKEIKRYTLVDTIEKANKLFDFVGGWDGPIVVDLESQSHDPKSDGPDIRRDKILGVGFSWAPGKAAYLPLRIRPLMSYKIKEYWKDNQQHVLDRLKSYLEDKNLSKDGQNFSYDIKMFWFDLGIRTRGFRFDTMLASHILDENQISHGLDEQVSIFVPESAGHKKIVTQQSGYKDMAGLDMPDMVEYCCSDCDLTGKLVNIHTSRLEEDPQLMGLMHGYAMPLQRALTRMEIHGAFVDVSAAKRLQSDMRDELRSLELQMRREIGHTVNVDSSGDVIYALQEAGLDITQLEDRDDENNPIRDKKGKTKYTTSREVLEVFADDNPIIPLILDTRAVRKLLGTYVTPIIDKSYDGRIHGNFWVHGTMTGRLSSSDPNLQNIPRGGKDEENVRHVWGKRVKELYVAPKGYDLIQADYSQMEVRTLAYYAKDQALANACDSEDVHLATACAVYGLDFDEAMALYLAEDADVSEKRQLSKNITFLIVYGGSEELAAKRYHVDLQAVKDFKKDYFTKFRGAERFIEVTHSAIDKDKFVRSAFGRIRRIPYAGTRGMAGRAHRQAVNSLIQGTAADICGRSIIRLTNRVIGERLSMRPILTVHDSIVFLSPKQDTSENIEIITTEMNKPPLDDFNVPLLVDVEVGDRWGKLHKVA